MVHIVVQWLEYPIVPSVLDWFVKIWNSDDKYNMNCQEFPVNTINHTIVLGLRNQLWYIQNERNQVYTLGCSPNFKGTSAHIRKMEKKKNKSNYLSVDFMRLFFFSFCNFGGLIASFKIWFRQFFHFFFSATFALS